VKVWAVAGIALVLSLAIVSGLIGIQFLPFVLFGLAILVWAGMLGLNRLCIWASKFAVVAYGTQRRHKCRNCPHHLMNCEMVPSQFVHWETGAQVCVNGSTQAQHR
jgi:hypothetical protein